MIQKCGADYNTETSRTNFAHGADACGKMFDDADRMTICPHPKLDDPRWRKKIDDYMVSKGYVWLEAESRYEKASQ